MTYEVTINMDEFYYWMYKGLGKIRSEQDPKYDAMLGVLFFIGLNIIVIGRIIFKLNNLKAIEEDVILIALVYALFTLIFGYFRLYKRKQKIIDKIGLFSSKRLKIGKVFFIIYIIISFISFYVVAFFY